MAKLEIPEIKKINNIGVAYIRGERKDPHYRHIIENILRVPEVEVLGIAPRGRDKFLFKVSNSKMYDYICKNFTCKEFVLDENTVIRIDDISSYGTRIHVSRVPMERTNDSLSQDFSFYGEVLGC